MSNNAINPASKLVPIVIEQPAGVVIQQNHQASEALCAFGCLFGTSERTDSGVLATEPSELILTYIPILRVAIERTIPTRFSTASSPAFDHHLP